MLSYGHKMVYSAIVFIFLSLCSSMAQKMNVDSIRPHIAIFRLSNTSGTAGLDAACSAASNSLRLTLTLLNSYEVVPSGTQATGEELDTLRAWAERNETDFILFGHISAPASGRFSCSLSLFDRVKGAVTISKQSDPVPALELFDTTDELIADMLDAMTGRHIGFGHLAFENTGEKGDYEVFIDGIDFGKNVVSINNVLIGEHQIRVSQNRILGVLHLAEASIALAENETKDIAFSAPAITDAERQKLEGLETGVRSRWRNASARDEVESEISEYNDLLKNATYSSALGAYRDRARQVAGEWKLVRARLDIEANAWMPDSHLFDSCMAIYLAASTYPIPKAIETEAESNALLLASLLELRAEHELAGGDLKSAATSLEGILDFARCLPAERRTAFNNASSVLAKAAQDNGTARQGAFIPSGLFSPKSIAAAKAFYSLQESTMKDPAAIIILGTDTGTKLSIGDTSDSQYPMLVHTTDKQLTVSYPKKDGTQGIRDIKPSGERIILVDTGVTSFGSPLPDNKTSTVGQAVTATDDGGLGNFTLPWLPEMAYVYLSPNTGYALASMESVPMNKVTDAYYISPPLKAGKYKLNVEPVGFTADLDIKRGGTCEPEGYQAACLSYLNREKTVLQERKTAGEHRLAGKWISVGTGIVGGIGAIAVYFLGNSAYTAYSKATISSEASELRDKIDLFSILLPVATGIGGGGFIISAALSTTAPNLPQLDASIKQLDQQIGRIEGGSNGL